MATNNPATLLVTGASGHLGRLVLRHLLETEQVPANQIIATTRNPQSLQEFADLGVNIRQADFDDSASLEQAFAGADRLLLISTDALDTPGKRLSQHKTAIAAAEKAGVKHILYTSLPKPDTSAILFAPEHFGTEQAIAATSLSWTLLRNNWYTENVYFGLPSALASGQWYSAAGEGAISYISREDAARAAAAALASDETENRAYTLTGSEAVTLPVVVKAISETIKKDIQVVDVPVDTLTQGMISAGLPEPVAQVLASFDVATQKGDLGEITNDFKNLTGRDPQSFQAWIDENQEALRKAAEGQSVAH